MYGGETNNFGRKYTSHVRDMLSGQLTGGGGGGGVPGGSEWGSEQRRLMHRVIAGFVVDAIKLGGGWMMVTERALQ